MLGNDDSDLSSDDEVIADGKMSAKLDKF